MMITTHDGYESINAGSVCCFLPIPRKYTGVWLSMLVLWVDDCVGTADFLTVGIFSKRIAVICMEKRKRERKRKKKKGKPDTLNFAQLWSPNAGTLD